MEFQDRIIKDCVHEGIMQRMLDKGLQISVEGSSWIVFMKCMQTKPADIDISLNTRSDILDDVLGRQVVEVVVEEVHCTLFVSRRLSRE